MVSGMPPVGAAAELCAVEVGGTIISGSRPVDPRTGSRRASDVVAAAEL